MKDNGNSTYRHPTERSRSHHGPWRSSERLEDEIGCPITCGTHVSWQFARVFADKDGNIYACPDGAAKAGIAQIMVDRIQEDKQ